MCESTGWARLDRGSVCWLAGRRLSTVIRLNGNESFDLVKSHAVRLRNGLSPHSTVTTVVEGESSRKVVREQAVTAQNLRVQHPPNALAGN